MNQISFKDYLLLYFWQNTAILKRRHPISVREIRYEVKTIKDDKYCIYDTIEETNCRKAKTLEVILLHPVEG